MSSIVEMASNRIAEMLEKSKETQSGVKLEVNENILESCTGLCVCVRARVCANFKSMIMIRETISERGYFNSKCYRTKHREQKEIMNSEKFFLRFDGRHQDPYRQVENPSKRNRPRWSRHGYSQ